MTDLLVTHEGGYLTFIDPLDDEEPVYKAKLAGATYTENEVVNLLGQLGEDIADERSIGVGKIMDPG